MPYLATLLISLNLQFLYFFRPAYYNNVFAIAPFIFPDKLAVLPTEGRIFVILRDPASSINSVEIDIGREPTSDIVRIEDNTLGFCTDKPEVIFLSKYGIELRVDAEFPCIVPPIKFGGKIWFVDLRGNLCSIEKEQEESRDIKCFSLDEESVKIAPEIINLTTPQMKVFQGNLFIAYRNKLFVLSDVSKYQLLELPGISISSFELRGRYLVVTTEDTLYLFEVWKKGGVIEYRKIFEKTLKNISGMDFDGQNIVVSRWDGFSIVNIRGFTKTVRIVSLFDTSNPILLGDHVVFAGSFGKYLKSIYPYKNSIILARFEVVGNKYKVSIEEEKIIHSFPKKIRRFDDKIAFITDDGTLYLFRIFSPGSPHLSR